MNDVLSVFIPITVSSSPYGNLNPSPADTICDWDVVVKGTLSLNAIRWGSIMLFVPSPVNNNKMFNIINNDLTYVYIVHPSKDVLRQAI